MSSKSCYYSPIRTWKALANVRTLDFKYRLIKHVTLSYWVASKYPHVLVFEWYQVSVLHSASAALQQEGTEMIVVRTALKQLAICPQIRQIYTSGNAGGLTKGEEVNESPQKEEEAMRNSWGRAGGRCQRNPACRRGRGETGNPKKDPHHMNQCWRNQSSQTRTSILTPSAHIFICGTDWFLTAPRQLTLIFCASLPLSPAF